jgi:hypothetical protein
MPRDSKLPVFRQAFPHTKAKRIWRSSSTRALWHAAAGVFTSNRFCAAPVQWSRKAVADGSLHAVVINSGGANACTGEAGYLQSAKTAGAAATQLGLAPQEVAVASTGLIGDLLPMDNVLQGVEHAFSQLSDSKDAGTDASYAIMTTDTMPKTVHSGRYRVSHRRHGQGLRHDRTAIGHDDLCDHHRCGNRRPLRPRRLCAKPPQRVSTVSTWTDACPQ